MANLIDVIRYICSHYPFPDELSQARLTKMVYLADWKKSIDFEQQMTCIDWKFNHYGPYVDDVVNTAKSDPRFKVVDTVNYYGGRKYLIKLFDNSIEVFSSLSRDDVAILDFVINKTSKKYWKDFINLIYSTYPIFISQRGENLNLVELAKKYKLENKSSEKDLL